MVGTLLVLLIARPGAVLSSARSVGTWVGRLILLPFDPDGGRSDQPVVPSRSRNGGSVRQTNTGPTVPFASVGGLTLRLPAERLRVVAYHEAAKSAALALHPLGRCGRNVNPFKFDCPRGTAGPRYVVMSSRGRINPATSAVDVAMARRSRVLSPVTGTVFKVKRYWLYGKYRDYRISLIPAKKPWLAVVMIHVTRIAVRKGDRVIAGRTVLAKPRRLPFHSQVNDYVGSGVSHVHLEVKRIGRQGLRKAD